MHSSASILNEIDTPITQVHPDYVRGLFRFRPLLERVVKPDTGYTIESVIDDIASGYSQLWIIGDFDAFTVTCIQNRPAEKVLWIEWMSGHDMAQWMSDWHKVQEAFARANRCAAVEFHGRIGYKRFEKRFSNVKPIRTLYRQELT